MATLLFMKDIPDNFKDLLSDQTKAFASVATVLKDGSPQVTPVWFDTTVDRIRINTATGRVKSRTMKEGRKVALSIMDPANPYRYMQIRGKVTKVTTDGADAHIDRLAPSAPAGGCHGEQVCVLVTLATHYPVANRFGGVLVGADVGDQRSLVLVEACRGQYQLGVIAL